MKMERRDAPAEGLREQVIIEMIDDMGKQMQSLGAQFAELLKDFNTRVEYLERSREFERVAAKQRAARSSTRQE
jgi:hypothetical protein